MNINAKIQPVIPHLFFPLIWVTSIYTAEVQVVIQDTILVQSGTLQPGKQVTTLNLLAGAEKQLSPGGYDGKLVILFYDEVTGEKAVVNTEIPVTITVTA